MTHIRRNFPVYTGLMLGAVGCSLPFLTHETANAVATAVFSGALFAGIGVLFIALVRNN